VKPAVLVYQVPVRAAAPQAVAVARGLAWLYGKAINGSPGGNGSIRYGWPGLDTQRTAYTGYVNPPQIFTGYDPMKVAAGFARIAPGRLPGTSNTTGPMSPLSQAMMTATYGVQHPATTR
jgi:hypothetical protein